MLMTGQRGWRVIRGGLGAGASIGATTRTGTGTSTATQTTLPARGAQYQTVVPQRPGGGLTTTLPERLPSTGTTAAPPPQRQPMPLYLPPSCRSSYQGNPNQCAIDLGITGYGQNVQTYPSATPPCPTGTTYDPTTGVCDSTTTTTSYWPWIVGGAVVVVIIILAARRR